MPNNTLPKILFMLANFTTQEFLSSIGDIVSKWSKVWAWMLSVYMCFGIIMKYPRESSILKLVTKTCLTSWTCANSMICGFWFVQDPTSALSGISEGSRPGSYRFRDLRFDRPISCFWMRPEFILKKWQKWLKNMWETKITPRVLFSCCRSKMNRAGSPTKNYTSISWNKFGMTLK